MSSTIPFVQAGHRNHDVVASLRTGSQVAVLAPQRRLRRRRGLAWAGPRRPQSTPVVIRWSLDPESASRSHRDAA
eukprot:3492964-Rhodomonas_salina.2